MRLGIILGPRGTGKTTTLRNRYPMVTTVNARDVARLTRQQLRTVCRAPTVHLAMSTSDVVDWSPDRGLGAVKLVESCEPNQLLVETDQDAVAQGIADYYPQVDMRRFDVSSSDWHRALSEAARTHAAPFAWLPIAIHVRALAASDPRQAYLAECHRHLGLSISRPTRAWPFFLEWHKELLRRVQGGAPAIQLISQPGQGKTTGVLDVAAHLGREVITLNGHELKEARFGKTASKLAARLRLVSAYVEATKEPALLLIDEANGLFRDGSRGTDIAGEEDAVKYEFNEWLAQRPELLTVVLAANKPLEISVASRARIVHVALNPSDVTNVVAARWGIERKVASRVAGVITSEACFDLRILDELKELFPTDLPTGETLVDAIRRVSSPRTGSQGDRNNKRLAKLEKNHKELVELISDLNRIVKMIGERR